MLDKGDANLPDELVFMCDDSTSLLYFLFGLIQHRVRGIIGVCHDDSFLWSNSDYSQAEKANKQVAQQEELHGIAGGREVLGLR